MKHELHFWREEGPFPLAADSLLVRLAGDRNLPDVFPLSPASITDAFNRYLSGIIVTDLGMEWRASDGSFDVSFNFDDHHRPKSVCIRSETPPVDTVFDRILAAARELGCTRIESRLTWSQCPTTAGSGPRDSALFPFFASGTGPLLLIVTQR